MKKSFLILLMTTITFSFFSCQTTTTMQKNPEVTIQVKGYTTPLVIELYPEVAPNTVNNFIHLASKGFYDGLIFHRIIQNFMIQGGGSTQSTCAIEGEFSRNGKNNPLKHERGVISMARTNVMNSATSQFFIVHKDAPHLDGAYAAFGKLVSGFETLDQIAAVRTGMNDRPVSDVVMESVKVELFGKTYPKPVCAN